MSKYFSVANAVANMESVLESKDELAAAGVDLIGALKMNHVVMQWVFGQPDIANQIIAKIHVADEQNISIIDELWAICVEHNIELTTAQKVELFQDFLDD